MNETYTLPFWQWRQIAFHLRQAAVYWHRLGNDAEVHLDLPDFAIMLHDRGKVCHEYADQFSARPSSPAPAAGSGRNDPPPKSGGFVADEPIIPPDEPCCTCDVGRQCGICKAAERAEAKVRQRLGLGPQPAMAGGNPCGGPDRRAWQTGEY